jgi:signal peptidase I
VRQRKHHHFSGKVTPSLPIGTRHAQPIGHHALMMASARIAIVGVLVVVAGCSSSTLTPTTTTRRPSSTITVGWKSFTVPSESMTPTLTEGEVVNVRSIATNDAVQRGDIIVFEGQEGNGPAVHEVKRVIGLPGEMVSATGGHVYIDGKELHEPYLPSGTETSDFSAVTLSPGHYWMLGDNRGNSWDSRVVGPILRGAIIGTVKPS